MPNWYHFSCFFKKFRVKATSDVAHFDSLRWDDQKKIEGHCTGGGGTLGGGAAAEPKGSAVQEMADLQVEYSKSSRATCRGCDEKIEIVSICACTHFCVCMLNGTMVLYSLAPPTPSQKVRVWGNTNTKSFLQLDSALTACDIR